MPRYPTAYERKANGGWCDWIAPKQGYRMACCDCGLVHTLQFKVVKRVRTKATKPGYVVVGDEVKGVRVLFRAQRHRRATAQVRRYHHPKRAAK
jgi:hypothetical protein